MSADGFVKVMVHLPVSIIERVDEQAHLVEQRTPGIHVSRSATIRSLLLVALRAIESDVRLDPARARTRRTRPAKAVMDADAPDRRTPSPPA